MQKLYISRIFSLYNHVLYTIVVIAVEYHYKHIGFLKFIDHTTVFREKQLE